MRITGGQWKGLTLKAPANTVTRPTSDANREALFNILNHSLGHEIGWVADFFAGSGALSFEALSYGGAGALLFESDAKAIAAIKRNKELILKESLPLFICSKSQLRDWPGFLSSTLNSEEKRLQTIFCDPPYRRNFVPKVFALLAKVPHLLHPEALFVAEMEKEEERPLAPGWTLVKERARGVTQLLFYRRS